MNNWLTLKVQIMLILFIYFFKSDQTKTICITYLLIINYICIFMGILLNFSNCEILH